MLGCQSNESNLGFEYAYLTVMELVLIMSISVMKLFGTIPIYSVIMMVIMVLTALLGGTVVGYWTMLLLGVVYIGGVGALMVYVGAISLFSRDLSVNYWLALMGALFFIFYLGDSNGLFFGDTWESFVMGFSVLTYIIMVLLMFYLLLVVYCMLYGLGGLLRLYLS